VLESLAEIRPRQFRGEEAYVVNVKKLGTLVVVGFVALFAVNSPKAAKGILDDGKKMGTHVYNDVSTAIKQITGQDK